MTKRALKLRAIAAMLGSTVMIATQAMAADEIFLKLLDVQGDSTDAAHPNEIIVTSYSQSVSNTATFDGGASIGKAMCGDIIITKPIDRSSPSLILKVLTGTNIPSGTLSFRRAAQSNNAKSADYYTVQLTNVFVTAVEQTSNATTASGVVELIKLKARTFRLSYTPQAANGQPGTPQTFGFDCLNNQRL